MNITALTTNEHEHYCINHKLAQILLHLMQIMLHVSTWVGTIQTGDMLQKPALHISVFITLFIFLNFLNMQACFIVSPFY